MKKTTRYLIALGLVAATPLIVVACGGDDSSDQESPGTGGTTGKGGSSGKGGTSQGGASQGGSSQGGSNQGGASQGGASQGGSSQGGSNQGGSSQGGSNQGGSNQGGSAGTGGSVPEAGPDVEEEAGLTWPTCDAIPSGVPVKTIPEIWAGNWADPEHVWVSGVYITGISKGGCVAGSTCQIFVQDAETFATLTDGAHHAIKLTAFSTVSDHFVGLAVGDKVDIDGYVNRSTASPPQNELMFSVNKLYPACMKKVGSGNPTPIASVKLSDLTVAAYETTHGPLLVKVEAISGKPSAKNTETFPLWNTSGPFVDAGVGAVVSASPYFLPNGTFAGWTYTGAQVVKFASITGVFGLFVPTSDGGTNKYLMLYPRQMSDLVIVP